MSAPDTRAILGHQESKQQEVSKASHQLAQSIFENYGNTETNSAQRLFLGLATLTKDKGCIVICDFQGVYLSAQVC